MRHPGRVVKVLHPPGEVRDQRGGEHVVLFEVVHFCTTWDASVHIVGTIAGHGPLEF